MENQPVTGEGSVFIEAHIRVPNSNEVVPIFTPDVVFAGATITERVDDFSSWEITVNTAGRTLVDVFLKNASAGATPRIRARIGLGSPTSGVSWLPWQELIVRQPISKIVGLGESSGYRSVIVATDLLWEINRVSRVLSRKGTISSIVQTIADFYGLPSVIEPTKYEGLWVQSYVSDYEFLRARMQPRALNDKNRGNYKFFILDNVLHFHTIDYQTTVKEFKFYASPATELLLTDVSQDILDDGAGGVLVSTHDPYSGIMQEIFEDRNSVLVLGNESPKLYSIAGVQRIIQYHIGSNRVPEALALATSNYENAKSRAFRAELTIPKSLFFRAGDIVNLVVNPAAGQTTPTSGYYYVPTVVHAIENTSLVSAVTFERGEWQSSIKSQDTLVSSSETVLSTKNSVVGQQLNLNATQSSQITKGAGKEAARKLFLATHNPETAL